MMSKDNNIDFSVSTTFQERLSKAFSGDERSNVEIAKEIGISKDVFIRALKAGLIPSTRTLIKIADHLEASIDYLLGLSDDNPQRKTLDDVSFLERLEELRILTNKKYGAIASAVGISPKPVQFVEAKELHSQFGNLLPISSILQCHNRLFAGKRINYFHQ